MFKVNYYLEKNGEFKLLDINGKMVFAAQLNASTNELEVKTAELPAGVYFGSLMEGDVLVSTHKIMISH